MRHNKGPIDYGKYPPRTRVRHHTHGHGTHAASTHNSGTRASSTHASNSHVSGTSPSDTNTAASKARSEALPFTSSVTNEPTFLDSPTASAPDSMDSTEHSDADAEIEAWIEGSQQRARAKGRRGARQGAAKAKAKAHRPGAHRDNDPARAEARRQRHAARTPSRPIWRYLRRISFGLGAILLLECAAATLTSRHFAVTDVEIRGAQETPQESLNTIRTSLIGQNWVRASRGAAQSQATAIPQVATAQIQRAWTWPPRLVLNVTERKPFARVGGGKDWWVVDESGMPFRRADKRDDDLYAVTGPKLQPQFGKALVEEDWKPVTQFARVLAQDERQSGGWSLRRVYFDRHGYASLRLTGGRDDETLVQLGADDWAEKLQTARWALADFAQTGKHAASLNLVSSTVTTWTPRVVQNTPESGAENQTEVPGEPSATQSGAAASEEGASAGGASEPNPAA
jgi:cell division septal protein FtsQ